MKHFFRIPGTQWQLVVNHVLPRDAELEWAAFLFARASSTATSHVLAVVDVYLAQPGDFAHQYGDYLELTDNARIRLLKRAQSLTGSIIEVHSHPGQPVAEFSLADMIGFRESVHQMRWRLRNQPYGAIVIAPSGFDALVWWDTNPPVTIDAVCLEDCELLPTTQTLGGASARPSAV